MAKTLTRIVLLLAGLVLLLAAGIMVLLQTSAANGFVENRLRAWVHPGLQINGDVQVSVFPKLGMDLRDVTIPSKNGAYPAVSIGQLQWQASWMGLFERTLALDSLYIKGLQIVKPEEGWAPLMADVEQSAWFDGAGLLDWARGRVPDVDSGGWRVLIEQALLEDVAVLGATGQADELALATLAQFQLKADVGWPAIAGSQASLGARRLSVNDADAFGHTPALLEQLGIAHNGMWDVDAIDSQWLAQQPVSVERSGSVLALQSLSASGAWGELSAANGTVNLATGAIAIPMQATLTNAPNFKSRAIEINVRQSRMRFELTGTLSEPGVQWLGLPRTSPNPSR